MFDSTLPRKSANQKQTGEQLSPKALYNHVAFISQAWPRPPKGLAARKANQHKLKQGSEILAIKKEKHFKMFAASINYRGAFNKNGKSIPGPPQRCHKNSDSKIFAYLFLLSCRICRGCPILKQKNFEFSKRKANMKHPTWQDEAMYASRSSRIAHKARPLLPSAWLLEATLLDNA